MKDRNEYSKLDFPRHLLLNMLKNRHYTKFLIVFIYLGFTVYCLYSIHVDSAMPINSLINFKDSANLMKCRYALDLDSTALTHSCFSVVLYILPLY